MVTLKSSLKGVYKKIHTVRVVAAPAPANTADITYIVGPTSDFTLTLSTAGIVLNNSDILRIDAKFIFTTGTASGSYGIQFNGDTGNNYAFAVGVRTGAQADPSARIDFHNSTQSGEVADYQLELKTEFGNNPGVGVVGAYKVLQGIGVTRRDWIANPNITVSGIWRNSSNNLTSIRFYRVSGTSTVIMDVGTEIRFYQELQV